jgi:hypothetical protein
VALGVLLVGCSSRGSPSGDQPSASSAAWTSRCGRLSAAVAEATRQKWSEPTQTDNGPLHQCRFITLDGESVVIQVADGESHVGFVHNRALVENETGPVKTLEDLGSEAYTQTTGSTALVAVRQGDVGVTVQLQGAGLQTAQAVARAALSALT